jgi:hypothetical protein
MDAWASLRWQCYKTRCLFTQDETSLLLKGALVIYVDRSFHKLKSRMVTALARREPFTLHTSYLMRTRVLWVVSNLVYPRLRDDTAGLIRHAGYLRAGFYHAVPILKFPLRVFDRNSGRQRTPPSPKGVCAPVGCRYRARPPGC